MIENAGKVFGNTSVAFLDAKLAEAALSPVKEVLGPAAAQPLPELGEGNVIAAE